VYVYVRLIGGSSSDIGRYCAKYTIKVWFVLLRCLVALKLYNILTADAVTWLGAEWLGGPRDLGLPAAPFYTLKRTRYNGSIRVKCSVRLC
jgi:hypothetical protein